MGVVLYYIDKSAPCRSVMLCIATLGIDVTFKEVDLLNGEQYKPEFLKINPAHQVPVLEDNGFYVSESRAILQYLVNMYGKNKNLYPEDPKRRSKVDQMLYFDMSLYQRVRDHMHGALWMNEPLDNKKIPRVMEGMEFLNTYIGDNEWATGSEMTIADFSLIAHISTGKEIGMDFTRWPNIMRWMSNCEKTMKNYDSANLDGAKSFGEMFRAKLGDKVFQWV